MSKVNMDQNAQTEVRPKLKQGSKVYNTIMGTHELKKFYYAELTEKHLLFYNYIEDDSVE